MPQGFIKLFREKALELLEENSKAFLLLTQIAIRARRNDAEYSSLKANQAFIGDHEKIGLSRQEYRSAQKKLTKYKLASFEPTNKGTIATLICTAVYDINADETSCEKPPNLSMQIHENEPTKNQSETMKEPTSLHHETIREPLTRKKEYNNAIMKENPHLHPTQTLKEPEDLEDWKKKMISVGWTEEEFNKAWDKFLQEPPGSVKNPRKWLEAVMQSIRDSGVKEEHLQKLADDEDKEKAVAAETSLLAEEEIERQKNKMVQENMEFMRKIVEMGIGKEKYMLSERFVKLLGGKWLGFCLAFTENGFKNTVCQHLGIDEGLEKHED